jgi:GT2 family glycosyltransferase
MMVKTLSAADEVLDQPSILAPAIYYYNNPELLWTLGEIRYRWLPMPLTVRKKATSLDHSPPFQLDYVSGCGMLVRRAVFKCIGMFDRRYFMYFEDADFCRRARDAGFTIWCVPQAKMWHKVSLSVQRDKSSNRYHRALNQVRFYHEHPHGPFTVLGEAYIAAKVIKTMLMDIRRGDWDLINPLWKGTLDGYRERRK